jgi:hypothetical protein
VTGLPSNDNCTELFGIQEAESAGHGDKRRSPLFEIARMLVRFKHAASRIENANHGMM